MGWIVACAVGMALVVVLCWPVSAGVRLAVDTDSLRVGAQVYLYGVPLVTLWVDLRQGKWYVGSKGYRIQRRKVEKGARKVAKGARKVKAKRGQLLRVAAGIVRRIDWHVDGACLVGSQDAARSALWCGALSVLLQHENLSLRWYPSDNGVVKGTWQLKVHACLWDVVRGTAQ